MDQKSPTLGTITESRQTATGVVEVVLLALILVLSGWFLVMPKMAQNQAAKAELATVETSLTTANDEMAELDRMVSKLKSSADNLKLVDEAIPLNGRITKLQALVENLAISSGMQLARLEAVNTGEIIAAGNKSAITDPFKTERSLRTEELNIGVTGTVDQFKVFLQQLENSSRILDVSDFQIAKEAESLNFSMKLKAYAYETK